jgi:hypothetical protein
LENVQTDPTSAVQCLSGLLFSIDTGQTTGTITSSTATERSVNNNNPGGYADGATGPANWGLGTSGSMLWLDRLTQPNASEYTIVGPPNGSNAYANANSSVTNNPHNPHIGLSASFVLNVPGVTAASTINAVTFQFNTSYGSTVVGEVVPEPTTVAALAPLLVAVVGRRRRYC